MKSASASAPGALRILSHIPNCILIPHPLRGTARRRIESRYQGVRPLARPRPLPLYVVEKGSQISGKGSRSLQSQSQRSEFNPAAEWRVRR